jgi:5'-nucleotidase
MRILITNDDGIDSEGLLALKYALSPIAQVDVIAPDRNWSVAGHNKTMDRPLRVAKVQLPDGESAYACDGTPSDCVSLAVLGFLPHKPDLVVAGINKGANLGHDITYSGTVGAAIEGVISGIPSIAVSLCDYYHWLFDSAARFTARLVKEVERHKLSGEVLLNVNVPNLSLDQIQGVSITRLGKRIYQEELVKRVDPFGRDYYWIGGGMPSGEATEGTDLGAIARGRISITPIHLDLTNHLLLQELREWNLDLDAEEEA